MLQYLRREDHHSSAYHKLIESETMATFKVNKVLVPTDLSKSSFAAFPYARSLARRYKAELYLLYVLPISPYIPPDMTYHFKVPEYELALRRDAEKQLEKITKRYFRGQKIVAIIKQGTTDEEILKVARQQRVNLIVMATHGRTGLEHALIGSVAEKVVRKAGCPVLTVKPGRK